MKRLTIVHVLTQLELGGAQLSTLSVLQHLSSPRHQLHLVVGPGGPLLAEACRLPHVTLHQIPHLQRSIRPILDSRALYALVRLFQRLKPELVHTHSSKAGWLGRLAALLARVPAVVHTIHGFPFAPTQSWWQRTRYWLLERVAAPWTTRLIAVSPHTLESGLAAGIGRPSQYHLIRYGIPASVRQTAQLLSVAEARDGLGLDPKRPTLGMVSCLTPQKNPRQFSRVISAIRRQVPDVQAVLVGDGVLRGEVEEAIRDECLEDTVRLLGWRRDVPMVLRACDVLIQTSRWEGMPLVCLEALSCGVPVVAFDVGGVGEVVLDGVTGYVLEHGDMAGLVKAVNCLLRSADHVQRMGQQGRRLVDNTLYDAVRMAREVEDLYAELLGLKPTLPLREPMLSSDAARVDAPMAVAVASS